MGPDDFAKDSGMKGLVRLRSLVVMALAGLGLAAPSVAHAACTGGSTLYG